MGRHAGGTDEDTEAVFTGAFGKVGGSGGGAVGAEDMGLEGDAKALELLTGSLHHRPVGIRAHDDSDFFHQNLSFVKKDSGYLRVQIA